MSIAFERAQKTFLGFLEARGKSLNTIRNYRCDLNALKSFCNQYHIALENIGNNELKAFHDHLKKALLKTNSQRRKLITAKMFLRYLAKRIDLPSLSPDQLIPPDKVEKLPKLVDPKVIAKIIADQPATPIGLRNQALLSILLETGMLVSEALALKPIHFKSGNKVFIEGKRERKVVLSKNSQKIIKKLVKSQSNPKSFLFYGFSPAQSQQSNPERLTTRSVELLFKAWSKQYQIKHLHPRTLRHLFVVNQLLQKKSQTEIMQILGLKTSYPFRVYQPIIDQISKKISKNDQQKSHPSLNPAV